MLPYFINKNGIKVGEIRRVYIKGRGYRKAYTSKRRPNHFFIKFNGFGIDSGILKDLIAKKIDWIVIDYLGKRGRVLFTASVDDWLLKGIPVQYTKDYEEQSATFGRQIILSKKFMKERCLSNIYNKSYKSF